METYERRLATLERRADYLAQRTGDDPSLSWDRAELGALRWAITHLRECVAARYGGDRTYSPSQPPRTQHTDPI